MIPLFLLTVHYVDFKHFVLSIIRSTLQYCCSASRPKTESSTKEESTEVKTETLSLKSTALPNGLVKCKTCEKTDETTYNNWYKSVYIPNISTATTTTKSTKASA
jgi:hypothetical protein